MNVFSRYTLYLVSGGKICPYDVIEKKEGETRKKNKQDAYT